MAEALVRQTPVEFFREQLGRAMQHQKVSTSAFTEYYLINLLAAGVHGDNLPPAEPDFDELPLALLYVRAMGAARLERARLLRAMGDMALFVSGYFADSLDWRATELSYYRAMGGRAYARLSRHRDALGLTGDVFSELSDRFTLFADLLSEVSENSRPATNTSVVRLYERWVQTGSPRAASLLAERGITPVPRAEGRSH